MARYKKALPKEYGQGILREKINLITEPNANGKWVKLEVGF